MSIQILEGLFRAAWGLMIVTVVALCCGGFWADKEGE